MWETLIPLGAQLLGGLMGDDEDAQSERQQIGFGALPPEVQQAYLKQYLPLLLSQFQGKYQGGPMGQAPQGQFASQGLQQLQQHSNQIGGLFNGGTGVNPLGQTEPLNQFQQTALGSQGAGLAGLTQELPGYQNLWNENVLNPLLADIDRRHGILQNNLYGSKAGNLGAFGSSALGTQLAQGQDNADRLKIDARSQGFQNSQALRNQTLQQMLNAGNTIQQQGQNELNGLQPQLQQLNPNNRLQAFGVGLGAFPKSGQSTGATAAVPNMLTRLGAGLQGAGGAGFGQLLGGGANSIGAGSYNPLSMSRVY